MRIKIYVLRGPCIVNGFPSHHSQVETVWLEKPDLSKSTKVPEKSESSMISAAEKSPSTNFRSLGSDHDRGRD